MTDINTLNKTTQIKRQLRETLFDLEKESKNLPMFNRTHYKHAIEDMRTALAKIDLI